MAHDHGEHSATRARLSVAIAIVGAFLVVEVAGALFSGSLTLLADAGHMVSDLLGLVVALVATVIAARPATDRQTFGFRRAEVFGALINGVILVVVAISVAIEAVKRLLEPADSHVAGVPMLVVAVVGVAANLATMAVLRRGAAESIGVRAAYLEVLGDLLGSIAAIIASVVLLTTGFAQADAIASLLIAALIVPRAIPLLRDVLQVLSDATPRGTDVDAIRSHILDTEGVEAVHDVHVWQITSGAPVFSAHVVVDANLFATGATGRLLDELTICLADHFDVAHSTFQLEPAGFADSEEELHK